MARKISGEGGGGGGGGGYSVRLSAEVTPDGEAERDGVHASLQTNVAVRATLRPRVVQGGYGIQWTLTHVGRDGSDTGPIAPVSIEGPPAYRMRFIAALEGVYTVRIDASVDDEDVAWYELPIRAYARKVLQAKSGRLSFLRVNDPGWGYGPPYDHIDADVIVKLDRHPAFAFGFDLRSGAALQARKGMLSTLLEAYREQWDVELEHEIFEGHANGIIRRVELMREAPRGAALRIVGGRKAPRRVRA